MSQITIPEPGMSFGPFDAKLCYHVEKCDAYKAIMEGVMMAEFLLIRQIRGLPQLWAVEAKSGMPHPNNKQRFDEFVGELASKLINAVTLCVAACLERHPAASNELPQGFRELDLRTISIRLVVVINKPEEYLPPIESALTSQLRPFIKTWAMGANPIAVLNLRMAQKYQLITAP